MSGWPAKGYSDPVPSTRNKRRPTAGRRAMSVFGSERDMHEWLRGELAQNAGLGELIVDVDKFQLFVPVDQVQESLFKSFNHALASLYVTEVISDDENISLNPTEVLKPDFLLYAGETQSLVIVELKNIAGPTREAGTEVSAYAPEVRAYLPFIADGDVINVIISSSWPALLKHSIFHEIFWMKRIILCLEPVVMWSKICLSIRSIDEFTNGVVSLAVNANNIGGYQLCLYDNTLLQGGDRNRLDGYISQMKIAMSAIAARGYALKSHGFAFLWKDRWVDSLAPYSITMVNFAPFQGPIRFLLAPDGDAAHNEMVDKFLTLLAEFDPNGHSKSLDEITDSGCAFLDIFCSPQPEGFVNWKPLREAMLQRCTLISFQGWGAFGDLFFERLRREHRDAGSQRLADCPSLGLELVDSLVNLDFPIIDLSSWTYEGAGRPGGQC
jgi:hypothetical protein